MGRKKRQGEPGSRSGSSSSNSCDENQNMSECPHVSRSVHFATIKKSLSKGFDTECEDCKKLPNVSSSSMEMDGDCIFDDSLWMCLRCGHQACGRAKNQHALHHYKTPRSDSHAVCVNTSRWDVWCYECDDEVNADNKKQLLEVIRHLKKQAENSQKEVQPTTEIEVMEMKPEEIFHKSDEESLIRARGLCNLGNTCFFNSVMQCLGQTPYLLRLLNETSQSGQYFQLPGGKLDPGDQNSIILDPLDGTLEEWRPLTAALAATLQELQSGSRSVYNPRLLFSKLAQRMPQFAGGDQHDSHELLRHLLEAVREEDLRRYQAVILDKMGLSKKTDPQTVEGDKKKIIKFYGQQASELLLPTEQVFRGVLVSTLRCRECGHTSRRDEYFLDLSLPIPNRTALLRKHASGEPENKVSKYQLKKEKKAAKKQRKQKGNRTLVLPLHGEIDGNSEKKTDSSESDADVEDNLDDNDAKVNKNSKEDVRKGAESGYNSEKGENGSPDSNNRDEYTEMRVDDSGVPSPAIGMLTAYPLGGNSMDNSPDSSETNIDMGSPLCGRNSPVDDPNDEYERPQSRLSFVNNKTDLKALDLEKLSIDKGLNIEPPTEESEDEKMDEDDCDNDLWMDTVTARYQCEEGELSVQTCLNQFTACELLEGNNQVSCDLCTKRDTCKKSVYTNATKQFLVYNPPAVLILHLKRFQVLAFRSAKVSTMVTFPLVLDLAPFCSKRSQDLPTFNPGQSKVLYSLYGIVEHSGGIHGGHYVAYVKVRPPLDADSHRWQFLPKNQRDRSAFEPEPEVPSGKWYYVSDSHVAEVPESKVLKSQAYLLFYERIL